jgi:hypothetical protein
VTLPCAAVAGIMPFRRLQTPSALTSRFRPPREDMQMKPDKNRDEALRRRAGSVPRRLRQSIDRYRVARGMTALWSSPRRPDMRKSCAG